MRPRTGPIGGMMTLSTSVVTILPNAAPMITPTARSMTLPREMNSRKLLQHGASWCGSDRSRTPESNPSSTTLARSANSRHFDVSVPSRSHVTTAEIWPENAANGSATVRARAPDYASQAPADPGDAAPRDSTRCQSSRHLSIGADYECFPILHAAAIKHRTDVHLCVDDQPCPSHRHSAG